MRVLADRRKRRTAAEAREIVARFEASGLTMPEFCRREGLARSVLCYWKKRLREAQGEAPGQFVELRMPETVDSWGLAPGELELSLPGGVTLRWRP